MSIKSQRKRREIHSEALRVRVRPEERKALQEFAATLGQTPSRIIRRLIREAITGGPDYFKDELLDLRRVSRELAAIGRNLNQLAKAANRGERVDAAEVTRVTNATRVQAAAVQALFDHTLKSVRKRTVVALAAEDREDREEGQGK